MRKLITTLGVICGATLSAVSWTASAENSKPASPTVSQETPSQGHAAGGAEKRWSVNASAGYQYDDNVTTDEIDNVSNLSDSAYVFEFSGTYNAYDGPEGKIELGYDFSQSVYDDLTEFNLQSHILSVSAERTIGEFDAGLLYLYSRTLLGGDDFLGIHNFAPSLGYSVLPELYLSGRYNYQNKNFIGDSGRDADQHAASLDAFYFFYNNRAYINVGYRLEDENTENDEFDYVGQYFHLRLKAPIPIAALERWNPTVRLGYAYFVKNYSEITASINDERKDERTTLTASLTADITDFAYIKADYERVEAISNLATSDFEEDVVTFSVGLRY